MSHQEALILAVQCRPVLWQKSHGGYKETTTRVKNNWVDVAKEMNDAVGANFDLSFVVKCLLIKSITTSE